MAEEPDRKSGDSDAEWTEFKASLPARHEAQRQAEADRRARGITKESVTEGLRQTPRPPVLEDGEWIARLSAEECADRGNAGCPGDTNDL